MLNLEIKQDSSQGITRHVSQIGRGAETGFSLSISNVLDDTHVNKWHVTRARLQCRIVPRGLTR